MSREAIQHLCQKVLIANPEGKKLMKLLRDWYASKPVFPVDERILARHGGALAWASFRSGQVDFLLDLEVMARDYEQKITAQQGKEK